MSAASWRDKSVLITGGSAGLGKSIARAFAESAARVVIAGRDLGRLDQTVKEFADAGLMVSALRADLTIEAEATALVEQVLARAGGLDVLVNNVGRSARGRLLDTSPTELRSLWECNFLSMVHGTRAAASALIRSRGQIVNIGSLASKSAARFLGGYPSAKFAVAAYSQQLRYELSDVGVNVLLVCPGPIERDDAGERYEQVAGGLPEAARRPGGGVKLRGISPSVLARKILWACEHRRPELVVPSRARWLFALQQLWPRIGDWILRRQTG